jgi:ABC-2 type transport system ATP-binding protein
MNESDILVIETRDLSKTYQQVNALKSLQATPTNGHVIWQVAVTDEAAAEAQLLRLVQSDDAVIVTEFGRKKVDLEEVFLSLIEGGNHVKP